MTRHIFVVEHIEREEEALMSSILDRCRAPFTSEILRRASGVLDERPSVIGRAVTAATPAILTGVLDTASTPAGMDRVRVMVRDGRALVGRLDDLGSLLADRSATDEVMRGGGRLVSTVFGHHLDAVTEALGDHAGMRRGAASSLLRLLAPIVMSVLARLAATDGEGFTGLMGLLRAQRSTIAGAIPRGMATTLGFQDHHGGPRGLARIAPGSSRAVRPRDPHLRLRSFLVAGAGGLLLLAVVGRPRTLEMVSGGASAPSAPTAVGAASSTGSAPEAAAPSPTVLVRESPRSTEAADAVQHAVTLRSGDSIGEEPRFVLGDFSFERGSARLTEESEQTLRALATVLLANPTVEIALEGHTDSAGTAAANQALSTARATAIQDGLVQAGVPRERITAAGHGSHRPLASNDTEDGRARNRRTEVIVVHH